MSYTTWDHILDDTRDLTGTLECLYIVSSSVILRKNKILINLTCYILFNSMFRSVGRA